MERGRKEEGGVRGEEGSMVDCCRKASLKWLMHCVCVCAKSGEVMAVIFQKHSKLAVSHLCDSGPLVQVGGEMFIYLYHQ